MVAVAPSVSVAVTVNISVPVAVGVPVMLSVPVPLGGTVRPGIAPVRLVTAKVTVPVPPLAVMVRL